MLCVCIIRATASRISFIDSYRCTEEDEEFSVSSFPYQFSHLKLIWDFLTETQAKQWRDLVVQQSCLEYLSVGFIQPIKWDNFVLPLKRCELSLVHVALYSLAVWDGLKFVPVDLNMFSGCVHLKSNWAPVLCGQLKFAIVCRLLLLEWG